MSPLLVHILKAYQYFIVDTLCKRKPLEDLAEKLKHLGCVLGFDLPFKSIHLVHVVRLMVTCRFKSGYCGLHRTLRYFNQSLLWRINYPAIDFWVSLFRRYVCDYLLQNLNFHHQATAFHLLFNNLCHSPHCCYELEFTPSFLYG